MQKLKAKTIFALLAASQITIISTATVAGQEASTTEHSMPETSQIAERGRQLRSAIDEIYKKMSQENSIQPIGNGTNSIVSVVTKYLVTGMPFAEAEETLRAAGFKVYGRKKSYFTSDLEVSAEINPYQTSMFSRTSVGVILKPTSQTDWMSLGSVEAEIVRVFL